MRIGVAKEDVVRRFLHPLAFFAAVLLLIGAIANGVVSALVCRVDCSTSPVGLRTSVAIALLGPGLVLALAAWDIAVTELVLRRSWRASGALILVPAAVWALALKITPAFGLSGLGAGQSSSLVTAMEAGAVTLWGLMCVLFVLPTPSDSVLSASMLSGK